MPATDVLQMGKTFNMVPLHGTKRGFAVPAPPVLRTLATGKPHPKDKEVDGRACTFTWNHPAFYVGTMEYKKLGKAGFTKTVLAVQEVTQQEWHDNMLLWRTYLNNEAVNFTSTHAMVTKNLANNKLISRGNTISTGPITVSGNTATLPIITTPAPLPTPLVVTPIPTPTWDPMDPDIAHDLFVVPDDNPHFLPDTELFMMLDHAAEQAMRSGDPRMMLIMGDTSTGKTESVIVWAARNDWLHCRIDCGQFGEIYDVTGPIKAVEKNGQSITQWVKGKTIRAMADPRPAVIHLDEINRISDVKAVNVLLPFLDSSKQSYFDDDQSWMKLNGIKLIIATMNGDTRGDDIGEYVGTQPLDQAFISRFPIRRQLRYPSPDRLKPILEAKNQGIIPEADIDTLALIATELVALNKFVPNLRELFACLEFLKAGVDMFHALKWTVGGVYKDDGTPASDYISFKGILIGKNIPVDEI